MNVEVKKVANGYLVMPVHDYRRDGQVMLEKIWVFRDFRQLCDSLQEILEAPEPK